MPYGLLLYLPIMIMRKFQFFVKQNRMNYPELNVKKKHFHGLAISRTSKTSVFLAACCIVIEVVGKHEVTGQVHGHLVAE